MMSWPNLLSSMSCSSLVAVPTWRTTFCRTLLPSRTDLTICRTVRSVNFLVRTNMGINIAQSQGKVNINTVMRHYIALFEKSRLKRNSEQPDGKQEQVEQTTTCSHNETKSAGAAVLRNRAIRLEFVGSQEAFVHFPLIFRGRSGGRLNS